MALDLGCGDGLYSQNLANRGIRVVGLDRDPAILRVASKKVGHGVAIVCGDATNLPFRADSFQFVVSTEVLSHLAPTPRSAALREVRRVARLDAAVFLTLHNRLRLRIGGWLRLRRTRAVYHTNHLDVWPTIPSEARNLACACGFSACAPIKYLNFHPRFTDRFYRRHRILSILVMLGEDLCSLLPLVRRLGIVFLLRLRNSGAPDDGAES